MLHMYTDGVDIVIAEDAEDATKLWEEKIGEMRNDDDDEWRQMPDDEDVKLWIEPSDVSAFQRAGLPDGAKVLGKKKSQWGFTFAIVAPVRSWVKRNGRCFWGSSEF